jgi:putative flippase GtrA
MPSQSSLAVRLINTAKRGDRFQLVRYFIAGVAVSLGYTFTIVALVSWLDVMGPDAANVVSFTMWTIISYVAHREFTFRFDGEYGGSAIRFIFVFLFKLGASVAVFAAINHFYQSSYLIGVIVNWVVLPVVSYLALKLWVFQRRLAEVVPVRFDSIIPIDPEAFTAAVGREASLPQVVATGQTDAINFDAANADARQSADL